MLSQGDERSLSKEEATIVFMRLKIQDFKKRLISIEKLSTDRIVSAEVKATLEDISMTLKAVEDGQ